MLFWIIAGLCLYLINVYLPTLLYFPSEGLKRHIGARDDLPAPSVLVQRARRSLVNFQENLPVFLGFGILALVAEGTNMQYAVWGAQLFVLSRAAYIVFYLYPVTLMRSTCFTIGFFGMLLMGFALV